MSFNIECIPYFISGVLIFISLINLIINYIKSKSTQIIPLNIILLSLFGITFYLISSINGAMWYYIVCKSPETVQCSVFGGSQFAFWHYGNFCIYGLFQRRLRNTYVTSIILNKKCYTVIHVLTILYFICASSIIPYMYLRSIKRYAKEYA